MAVAMGLLMQQLQTQYDLVVDVIVHEFGRWCALMLTADVVWTDDRWWQWQQKVYSCNNCRHNMTWWLVLASLLTRLMADGVLCH